MLLQLMVLLVEQKDIVTFAATFWTIRTTYRLICKEKREGESKWDAKKLVTTGRKSGAPDMFTESTGQSARKWYQIKQNVLSDTINLILQLCPISYSKKHLWQNQLWSPTSLVCTLKQNEITFKLFQSVAGQSHGFDWSLLLYLTFPDFSDSQIPWKRKSRNSHTPHCLS